MMASSNISIGNSMTAEANMSGSNAPLVDRVIASVSPARAEGDETDQASPDLMNVSPIEEKDTQELSMLDELRQREWLTTQNMQLTAQRDSNMPDFHQEIDELTHDQLLDMYEKLSDELIQKNVVYDSRQILIQAEHLRETIMSLWKQGDDADNPKAKELENYVDQMRNMNSKVCKAQQERKKMQETLEALKRENFELLKKSREMYAEIEVKRKKMEENIKTLNTDDEGKKLQEDLNFKTQMDVITRNVLQMLIVGSGVNWAQDPDLQKTLIDCGKHHL